MTDKMKCYKWIGINPQGKRLKGVIQVADIKNAQYELKKNNIEIISINPKHEFSFSFSFPHKKIKQKDTLLFTRYLSTMLSAGLPIIQALEIISRDQENPVMQSMVISIKNNITSGKTLAESFSEFPDCFNSLYCNLINAGEKSGTLDKILKRLITYLERSENLRSKIKKAMIYPIAIIFVAIIVSLILLLFVVPQFQTIFKSFGAQLPAFTRMVVNISNFLRSYWALIFIVVFILIWSIKTTIHRYELVRQQIDKMLLKLIIIGPIVKKSIIARFTRMLAITLEAGMPIVESMKTMSHIMDNSVYTNATLKICDDVANGNQLSLSMNATKLFPNMAIQMISVGEASGSLSEMLNNVANYYEEEVNGIVDNLGSLLEPVIMVILGIIIGSFVIAMYLPIFKLGSLY